MIKTISVIGSGIMGSQIAGHLANCGYHVLLLDISTEIVNGSLEKLKKSKPPALFTPSVLGLITAGNINDDLERACTSDWIIEVVPEKVVIKRDIYSKIEKYVKNGTIITSNTSGLSLSILLEGRSEAFRKAFFITHFFNPVRYMKLVEIITSAETDPQYVKEISKLLSVDLGKGVVPAKDTPGFIGNRIGVYMVMNAINKAFAKKWPIDLIDAVIGKASPFASSAIFRTADLVGLDTLMSVARNTYELCPADPLRDALLPHPLFEKLVAGGSLGEKSGAGFFKKGKDGIEVLDTENGAYRAKAKYSFESLKKAMKIEDPSEQLRILFSFDDEAARIGKELILDILVYTASVADEISNELVDIDNAMKWGYHWKLGPFEMWKAIGYDAAGERTPTLVKDLASGKRKVVRPEEPFSVGRAKAASGTIADNAGAALVDIGDGVVCCEFHTKMNAIDPDIISILGQGVDLLDAGKFSGMVISNDADDFSAGANLFMIAMAISSGSFDQIEKIVRDFQDIGQRLRFSKRPIVAAPFGRTLGGGCEVCLAAGNVVVAAETYIGLVELGVGLIPAGGGCKNMLLEMEKRALAQFDKKNKIWFAAEDGGPFPKTAKAFETIAMAKVAVSALDAAYIGYLPKNVKFVMEREKLLMSAKEYLLSISAGYSPPAYREDIFVAGEGGMNALVEGAGAMKAKGLISEYDLELAKSLAYILTGGNIATNHKVSEQDILDLEREVFLKLCGQQKTVERIQSILTTGRPLRN